MKKIMKRMCLIALLIISLFLFNGCSENRQTPPLKLFEEYGDSVEIASTSLYIDQASQMLDSFDIDNNYSSIGKDIVVVYLIESTKLNKFYEIYYPVNEDYEIIVRETVVPDFSNIQKKINDYILLNNEIDIEVYEYYYEMFFFPNAYDGDFNSRITGLDIIDSPIILKVGTVNLGDSYAAISLAKYENDDFVLFYKNIISNEIVIISEFNILELE